jgi:hypothetical protein
MASGDFRDKLLAGLGGEWPKGSELNSQVLEEKQEEGFRRLRLDLPRGAGEGEPRNHRHGLFADSRWGQRDEKSSRHLPVAST